ncbi:MAG TPA: outer membrane beta-barrel protein [Chitinophagaceae bacterium]|nr:outer membrane beta-barrel protein [Chitinophagaceae bacterium]
MFYIKSDDIEDLFREAADKYEVDTEKAAAWDDVYEAVHGDDKPAQPPHPENGNKKRWLNLLWLLLIPLGWFAHNAWNNFKEDKTPGKQTAAIQQAPATLPKSNAAGNTTPAGAAAAEPPKATASTGALTIKNKKIAPVKAGDTNIHSGQAVSMQIGNTARGTVLQDNNNIVQQTNPLNNKGAQENIAVPVNPQAAGTQAAQPAPGNTSTAAEDIQKDKKNVKGNKNGAKPGKKNGHYFYAGLVASPDISFIHFQKTSPVGASAGLLAGYQFNKRISVETGIFFDSKNYYTKGKYFDKSKIAYFVQHPEIVVNSVQGDCRMIEIPVNVRYTFTSGKKNNLYAIAGLSSYLMGREYYDYEYSDMNYPYTRGVNYNNHVKNWFSIANFGIGYQRSLGLKTSLRVEPFIKVPVSGVGTANMSITSAGLYFGITRKIP